MQDFEKLGAFYLGRRIDDDGALTEELTLYDSADLTTHAVIVGMTGSGKTGLGIGLIEEAAIDRVPVIAIDPKGDLGNLLLNFPKLRGADFEPWVDPRAAEEQGIDVAALAENTAGQWRQGLADWGQTPERMARLRDAADTVIYTPGSNAGRPLSVLREFTAPSPALRDDAELYRDKVQGTATGLLTLLGIDADPLTSREHLLLTNVLDHAWRQGRSLDLAGVINAVQSPAFERVGVMDVDTFFPPKERFELAMQLNNLLAAPGFAAWMAGAPLAIDRLLYGESGKPRVSILSIAHLNDAERMFFVTLLLTELLAWMRQQSGTSSLRAILYIDEIFGYMPPVANPASKSLLLTLLKQARAFGLGVVLSTQNPVDLDYKGLSNTGTWFIGRLQTERDQARVRDGLAGSEAGGSLNAASLKSTLAGLGKRQFLLHNVHENAPVLFATRWVMSYLAGPLTRAQIRSLTPAEPAAPDAAQPDAAGPAVADTAPPAAAPGIGAVYLPPTADPGVDEARIYTPGLLAAVTVDYHNARLRVDHRRSLMRWVEPLDGPEAFDWGQALELVHDVADCEQRPESPARFRALPSELNDAKQIRAAEQKLARWIRTECPLRLLRSPSLKVTSAPEESERDFRIRLQQLGRERRDAMAAKLRQRYDSKVTRLEARLLRAQQAVDREADQARQAKLDTAVSFGTALIGALLGRKRLSATSASKVGTAVKRAGRASQQSADVTRAEQTVAAVQAELEALALQFDAEVAQLDEAYDAQTEELKEIIVRARTTGIDVRYIGIGWLPGVAAT